MQKNTVDWDSYCIVYIIFFSVNNNTVFFEEKKKIMIFVKIIIMD